MPPYVGEEGKWATLLQRQNAARSGLLSKKRIDELLEGGAVPEYMVKAKYQELKRNVTGDPILAATDLSELAQKTLLQEKTILHLFDKWSGELKAKVSEQGGAFLAAEGLATISCTSHHSRFAQNRPAGTLARLFDGGDSGDPV